MDEIEDTTLLLEPDDYWNGKYVYITSAGGAAPEGEERAITDYSRDTQLLTVSPDFTAAVATGDEYEILSQRRSTLKRAINQAIRESRGHWLVKQVDTTTVDWAEDTYVYSLPADVVNIEDIFQREDSDSPWTPVPARFWAVEGTSGSEELLLWTGAFSNIDDTYEVRIVYTARPSELTNDTDTLGIGSPDEVELCNFIVHWALYILHDKAANRNPAGDAYQAHYTQADLHLRLANEALGTGKQERKGRWHGINYPISKG